MERGGFHGYYRPQKCLSEGMNRLPELEDDLSQKPMVLMPTASFDDNPASHGSGTATTNNAGSGTSDSVMIREQDRYMPIANVIRIMRKVLPSHAKISDDAKETIQECVSEYISFITGEANDRCQREQRKTITAEDVLWAMNKLGFDDYIAPLATYLHRYRELEGDHRGSSLRSDPPCLPKRAIATAAPDLASCGPVPAYHYHHPGLVPSSPAAASCASPSTSNHVARHDQYSAAASTSADDKQLKYHHAS